MNRRFIPVLCCALTAILGACKAAKPPAEADYFKTPFQTESQFIVYAIVSDLAEQSYFAATHRSPDPKSFAVSVTEKPGSSLDTPTFDLDIQLDKKLRLKQE